MTDDRPGFIAQVKAYLDIMDVAEHYFDFDHRVENGHYVQVMCDHDKATPSLTFYPSSQRFFCFGCGQQGDVVALTAWRENCSMGEAAKILVKRYNIPVLRLDDPSPEQRFLARQKLLTEECHQHLLADTQAMAYLESRGISKGMVETWKLGLSADTMNNLYQHRIMLPIRDMAGNVRFFGYRQVPGYEYAPESAAKKYVNSSDGPYTKKGDYLFGAYEALRDAKKTGMVVLVEGYFDAIALHDFYIPAVALMGTSVTEAQAKTIASMANKVVMWLDPDDAGRRAMTGITQKLAPFHKDTYVLWKPGGDPDEVARKMSSPDLWALFNTTKLYHQFLVDELLDNYRSKIVEMKLDAFRKAEEILATASPVVQELMKDYVLKAFDTTKGV